MSNVVEAMTEAALAQAEKDKALHRSCEKIFGHTCWRQGATLHEAPAAKGQTREATSYFCRTLLSDLGDWKKCSEARVTGFHVRTPII